MCSSRWLAACIVACIHPVRGRPGISGHGDWGGVVAKRVFPARSCKAEARQGRLLTCLGKFRIWHRRAAIYTIYRRPGFNCVVKQLRFWLFKVDCEFKDCDLRVLRIGHTCVICALRSNNCELREKSQFAIFKAGQTYLPSGHGGMRVQPAGVYIERIPQSHKWPCVNWCSILCSYEYRWIERFAGITAY